MTAQHETRSQRRYRLAFVGTAMLMVGIIVPLPFSLASVVDDVLGPAAGKVIPLLRVPPAAVAPAHSRLHLAVTHIDEVQLLATLRVSGHRVGGAGCTWRDRLLFVSVAPDDDEVEGLSPSASILLPAAGEAVSETIQLPVSGVPIRYPFDRYHLVSRSPSSASGRLRPVSTSSRRTARRGSTTSSSTRHGPTSSARWSASPPTGSRVCIGDARA